MKAKAVVYSSEISENILVICKDFPIEVEISPLNVISSLCRKYHYCENELTTLNDIPEMQRPYLIAICSISSGELVRIS